ncbi:MAG TPA: 30S ribosomal protein S6 [Rhodospirillaceae bacterium]|jgi:small subunit ribosomal protein S6|nr:30S ribosomal protein S6 [Rhodospirillaceae bacterium]HIJ44586.1 30S ribosomal protein S6 [Rhodospirillaceae bacterium]HIJ93147.1 30S ribosomal protein S6 [Rhodospirillaceae bacterium]HJP53218.1 30S ribosomal protein S6 [Rhodospirillales bacterium]
MPLYESVFIARQDISASQADALADDFSKSIEENGGKVVSRENWGLRTLAYRIKKNRKGHYILLNIDAPAAAVQEMERQMRLHEYILRYLTLKVDELATEPSLMVQNLAPRDEHPHHAGGGGGGGVNDKQTVKGDGQ